MCSPLSCQGQAGPPYDPRVRVRCLSIHAGYRCRHSGACCSGVFAIRAEPHVVEIVRSLDIRPRQEAASLFVRRASEKKLRTKNLELRTKNSELRTTMTTSALERFLRYVVVDTRSDEHSTTVPSTPGQLVLLRQLVSELQAMGIADAVVDARGYVMATIPATTAGDLPVIGFIAHVDTSPEMPRKDVRPIEIGRASCRERV